MREEKERVKKKLDKELETVTFSKHHEVVHQLNSLSWKQKLSAFWNKEIEVPIIPIGAISLLLLIFISTQDIIMNEQDVKEEKISLQVEGTRYWMVKNDEH